MLLIDPKGATSTSERSRLKTFPHVTCGKYRATYGNVSDPKDSRQLWYAVLFHGLKIKLNSQARLLWNTGEAARDFERFKN